MLVLVSTCKGSPGCCPPPAGRACPHPPCSEAEAVRILKRIDCMAMPCQGEV